jgi:hypothetical protein
MHTQVGINQEKAAQTGGLKFLGEFNEEQRPHATKTVAITAKQTEARATLI